MIWLGIITAIFWALCLVLICVSASNAPWDDEDDEDDEDGGGGNE